MYLDNMDYQQARAMEDSKITTQVSSRPKTSRTTWNSSLLDHHDCLVPSDPSRIRDQASARCSTRHRDTPAYGNWCVGRYRCRKGYHRDRLHTDKDYASPSFGAG